MIRKLILATLLVLVHRVHTATETKEEKKEKVVQSNIDEEKSGNGVTNLWDIIRENPLPELRQDLENSVRGKNIVMIIGEEGHGKTTTAYYLAGYDMYMAEEDNQLRARNEDVNKKIGSGQGRRKTKMFEVVKYDRPKNRDYHYVDFPGLKDSNADDQKLVNDIALYMCARNAQSVRAIFCVMSAHNLDEEYIRRKFEFIARSLASIFANDIKKYEGNIYCLVTKGNSFKSIKKVLVGMREDYKEDVDNKHIFQTAHALLQTQHIKLVNPADNGQCRNDINDEVVQIKDAQLNQIKHGDFKRCASIKEVYDERLVENSLYKEITSFYNKGQKSRKKNTITYVLFYVAFIAGITWIINQYNKLGVRTVLEIGVLSLISIIYVVMGPFVLDNMFDEDSKISNMEKLFVHLEKKLHSGQLEKCIAERDILKFIVGILKILPKQRRVDKFTIAATKEIMWNHYRYLTR